MQDTRWLTPDALLRRLGLENITLSETDSTRIESALRIAQAEIETLTGRRYAPLMKTVVHWARPGDVMLALRDDLLELSSVRDADGVDYAIADITWHGGILCLPDGVQLPGGPVEIGGLWAFHPAPDQAFRDTEAVLAAAADSADVTITLDDVDGADAWGDTPRVRIGHLIRIGDELLRVTAIAGDMLTVRRGENGTAPVDHAANAPILRYVPAYQAKSLALRLAAWLYREGEGEHGRAWPAGIDRGLAHLRRVTV
ncbi:MAG: hypothetical protein B6D42_16835 [Anaerolineae bacterium UTCFX5]|jgi:hypothetical protein|nr:MAG: hypothetical protein B6D42_16835 [Anaerolineae bacterium UTCFX5]